MLMNPDDPSEAEREVGIFTAVADKSCRRVSCQMHTPAGTYGKDMLIESVGNSILESPHGRHACTPIVPNVNSMRRMADAIPPRRPSKPKRFADFLDSGEGNSRPHACAREHGSETSFKGPSRFLGHDARCWDKLR